MDDSKLPRDLELLYEDAIRFPDPFHFSADKLRCGERVQFWKLRRLLIERLGRDLDEELAFLEELSKYDTRNQLVWAHRRWIVKKFGHDAPKKDLESTKKIIHEDANNPLAWSHRQWVFQTFGGDWEHELTYCDKIIQEDIFNSFAWDQRYFVVSKSDTLGEFKAMRDQEVSYALQAIDVEPGNECPWTYLRLLYKDDMESLVMNRQVEGACLSVFEREKDENKRDRYNAYVVDDVLIDRRGHVHAFQMVLDLTMLGLKPSQELLGALRALCQFDPGFVDKARSVLEDAKSDVYEAMWRSDPRFANEDEMYEALWYSHESYP